MICMFHKKNNSIAAFVIRVRFPPAIMFIAELCVKGTPTTRIVYEENVKWVYFGSQTV